jgi:hypothetical protein
MNDCESFHWYIENTNSDELPGFVRGRVLSHMLVCEKCRHWALDKFPCEDSEEFSEIPEDLAFHLKRDLN